MFLSLILSVLRTYQKHVLLGNTVPCLLLIKSENFKVLIA